jgi:hypothetical protein
VSAIVVEFELAPEMALRRRRAQIGEFWLDFDVDEDDEEEAAPAGKGLGNCANGTDKRGKPAEIEEIRADGNWLRGIGLVVLAN